MPVTLRCRCQHTFTMPANRYRIDGAHCPLCKAVVFARGTSQLQPGINTVCGAGLSAPSAEHAAANRAHDDLLLCIVEAQRLCAEGIRASEEELECHQHLRAGGRRPPGRGGPLLVDLFGPPDDELDDPDSPRHQGAIY